MERNHLKALVTGANGGLGQALCARLERDGWEVHPTDIESMDVRNQKYVWTHVNRCFPDVIFHLAGLKLAVDGELEPEAFAHTNITGTANVARAARPQGTRLIFASTCKAADPETAYGATKLVAERVVLNSGGTVVRLFNILESGPSVLDIWRQIPESEPIPYTDCWRYLITLETAVNSLLHAVELPSGRYAPNPGEPRHMRHVAREHYPTRELVEIPRRRGDRHKEPLTAACEYLIPGKLLQIVGPHDPELATVRVAA